ncbi:MAG: LPS assembly lipoprotein LptE [Xanthobacteraceae bacterium]|nr:LPS assembly lipoprotein LptE [Xanthobacteraceae bacterium]
MWWREPQRPRRLARLALVLAAAGLTAGCWEPLYGTRPGVNAESVQDKFAAVDIPPIDAPRGTLTERVALGMRNALQYDLHNGANALAPTYALKIIIKTQQFTAELDPTTGRPNTQVETISAKYDLIELATGKVVVTDNCFAQVDYDNPGSQQRFAGQRGRRDAEDRAIQVAAQTIRNRLASYFVAGT